jgi:hypothetical protein
VVDGGLTRLGFMQRRFVLLRRDRRPASQKAIEGAKSNWLEVDNVSNFLFFTFDQSRLDASFQP